MNGFFSDERLIRKQGSLFQFAVACAVLLLGLGAVPAWPAEWTPGTTYFQGDTVEFDLGLWTVVASSNTGWEQIPPNSASLSAVWQAVSVDTCLRAWRSGETYVQGQVVLDSGILWEMALSNNAGWESWPPGMAVLWSVWNDLGPWEDYDGCYSPSDHDNDGIPDVFAAPPFAEDADALWAVPDRWTLPDGMGIVYYDFSAHRGYSRSTAVPLVLSWGYESTSPPIFSKVETDFGDLPLLEDGYHLIGPEMQLTAPGFASTPFLLNIPLPDRIRNATIADLAVYRHDSAHSWTEVRIIAVSDGHAAVVDSSREMRFRLAAREKDVVWAPGYEQQNFVDWASNPFATIDSLQKWLSNSPTFFDNGSLKPSLVINANYRGPRWLSRLDFFRDSIVRPAVAHVADAGFNTIDLLFYHDSASHRAASCMPGQYGFCKSYAAHLAFNHWIKAIRDHNAANPGQNLRIRARFPASGAYLLEFYETFDSTSFVRQFGNSCEILPQSILSSFVDPISRGSRLAAGLGLNDSINFFYYNLSDSIVKQMYDSHFCLALNELQRITGNDIEVDKVTLVLDKDGETGLDLIQAVTSDSSKQLHTGKMLPAIVITFPDSSGVNGLLFPKEWWIDYPAHIDEILAFENARKEVLRSIYSDFAIAIAGTTPVYAPRQQMKAAVFYQDWVGDALYRGALNGYDLVRGTGIQFYHHTMYAVPFEMQRATQAFPIGIRNAMGMNFDNEMSWAHWDKRILLDRAAWESDSEVVSSDRPLSWAEKMLSAENARNFRDQADAAIQADAEGYVLCNWSIQDILYGTSHMDSARGAAWARIVGTGDDEHLHGPGGIVSSGPNNIRKRIALYISDPVALLAQLSDTWMEMLYGTGSWYEPIGGIFGKMFKQCQNDCEVAVVNDALILDTEGAILDLYDEIWEAYPNENLHYFALRDTCIARTKQGAAYQYLLTRPDKAPVYPFPIELYPPTF